MEIVPADTFEVREHREEMDRLLLLIAGVADPEDAEEWAARCFVSDESRLGDFMLGGEQRKELECKLGFPVAKRDRMAAIAAGMRQLNERTNAAN